MAKSKLSKKSKTARSKWIYLLVTIVVVAITMFILEITNTTHIFHKTPSVSAPSKPITHLPQQQSSTVPKKPVASTPITQGTANDENGKVLTSGVSTNPDDWTTSSSGNIVVKLPTQNSTFKSGSAITGISSVGNVQYRLIDSSVGQIAQGQLNVVNGNFTATINFTAYSNGGQLDVYTTAPNGSETNEVQIPVNF